MAPPDVPHHSPDPRAPTPHIIRLEGITKSFPGVIANQDVSITIAEGAFHAIIGENGAGKSTLLNILYGRYRPDSGTIFVRGEDITHRLHGPADSIAAGIGLVSQHYSLIPALTVLENVMLGAEPLSARGTLDIRRARRRVEEIAESLGLTGIDVNGRADRLSVAAQQMVEIIKALYRSATILLLDEPTATLAPQEASALYALLHELNGQGATIVFVTHKLGEVMANSASVDVLRSGRNAGSFETARTSAAELLSCMIGDREASPGSPGSQEAARTRAPQAPLLSLSGVSVRGSRGVRAAEDVSLELNCGEILGFAGVDGSGQRELSEAIVGIRRIDAGRITIRRAADAGGTDISRRSVRARQRLGVAYIPEDRHRSAMIPEFTIAENLLLGHENEPAWGGGLLLAPRTLARRSDEIIHRYDVRLGSRDSAAPAGDLSGGNQQKIVIARALESDPALLVACQPTRGLDTAATAYVYDMLTKARARGLGILLFSLDLDELLLLSDRIAVLYDGRIAGIVSRADATPSGIGALMTHGAPGGERAS